MDELLEEPLAQGYSPRCPKVVTGRYLLALSALGADGYRSSGVKPAPLTDARLESFRLRSGDLLLSRSNTRQRVGRAGIYDGQPEWCAFPDLMLRLRPDRARIEPRYLELYLQSSVGRSYFESLARGTSDSMLKLPREVVACLPVVLPPLAEQRRVLDLLTRLDVAREAGRRALDQAVRLRERLLARFFDPLLPIVGAAVASGRSSEGSPPAGWRMGTLGEVCRLQAGATPKRGRPEYWDGDIPWVRTGEIRYRPIRRAAEHISDQGLASCSARVLPVGTLLMAMYGQGTTGGRVALLEIEAATNQACLAILPGRAVSNELLFYYFRHQYGRLRQLGAESGRRNLNIAQLRTYPVPIPPQREQERMLTALRAVDQRIERGEATIRSRRRLRRGLAEQLIAEPAHRLFAERGGDCVGYGMKQLARRHRTGSRRSGR